MPKHGKPTDEDWRAFFASVEQMERGKAVIEAAVELANTPDITGPTEVLARLCYAVYRYEESNQ